MRLVLVNPNSTDAMTHPMADAARKVANAETEIIPLTAAYGPPSIEGYYDEVFAIPPMIDAVNGVEGPIHGVVVACFDDTGVDALRTLLEVPVIGICQAAMQMATILAGSFTVVTSLPRSIPALELLALKYGYDRHCCRVRAANVPVLDLEGENGEARLAITRQAESALTDDGAEAIVLGCAGMVTLSRELSRGLGAPVVEGVTAAVKLVESLHRLGLTTTTRGGYATPRQKSYTGEFARFSPPTERGR